MSSRSVRRQRRGNYSMLSALMIFMLAGFGAISIDLSFVRLGVSQTQDVADAASQAAIVYYREALAGGLTESAARTQGEYAATYIVGRDYVVGAAPTITQIRWGNWDSTAASGSEFTATSAGSGANAAQVDLSRNGSNSIGMMFGPLLGWNTMGVTGSATSAARSLQIVLALDVTGSWDKDEFQYARQAAVAFYDIIDDVHGPDDRFGVEVWWSNFAYELVPMMKFTDLETHTNLGRDILSKLNVGNYSGNPQPSWEPPLSSSLHVACKVYGTSGNGTGTTASGIFAESATYEPGLENQWGNVLDLTASVHMPGKGCHNMMPRYYQNETGTDHHTGLMMARKMIKDQKYWSTSTSAWITSSDPLAYRAVIVLTDGLPTAISTTSLTPRSSAGVASGTGNTDTAAVPAATSWTYADSSYPETWQNTYGISLREYRRDTAHALTAIQTDTTSLATSMFSTDRVNIWFVSFRDDNTFMDSSSVGDGYYSYIPTGSVSELVPTFQQIARSLPTSIVK